MPDPITVLTTLAYAVVRNVGSSSSGPNPVSDIFAQLFGGAAGNAFHGDVQELERAFLGVSRPDSNKDLARASTRSALHAQLFCLMESLGEPLDPPPGKLEKWWICIQDRLPQGLKDFRRPLGGILSEALRAQLIQAKTDSIEQLKTLELSFVPSEIKPHQMLVVMEDGFAEKCAADSLAGIESKHGKLPSQVHRVFSEKWFGYLCTSFHHEIKQNQPVANILLNISLAELARKVEQGFAMVNRRFNETQNLIREGITPAPRRPNPFASVPPLPSAFIDRPELTDLLIEKLISSSTLMAITAIEGMGGVGKTMIAERLCHDAEVQKAFPDGIIWLTIGKEANTPFHLYVRQVAQALGEKIELENVISYRSLLTFKKVLIALDDVWSLDAVEPFLIDPCGSRILYTSRDKSLAGPLGADNNEVGVLDANQARCFLSRWSGRESVVPPEPYASEILDECKGLVLGLAMIGAALKNQPDREWAFMVSELKKARLKNIRVQLGGYSYQTLHACIAASVDALDPMSKERYLSLAILPEDVAASESLLQSIWGCDAQNTHRTARLFVDRSLAGRDAQGNIHLHDFQLDYVREEFSDQETLPILQHAIRQCFRYPANEEFSSQMTWKLLPKKSLPGVSAMLNNLEAHAPRPRLLPLGPRLNAAANPHRGHHGRADATPKSRVVALSMADGRAVSATGQTIQVWDLGSDQPPSVFASPDSLFSSVAVSARGMRAIFSERGKKVMVWDLRGNRPLQALEGHQGPVTGVDISDDGTRGVSVSQDKTLRVWDLLGSQSHTVLSGDSNELTAVSLSPDGDRAVSGSKNGTVRYWDLEAGGDTKYLWNDRSWGTINAVALSADGSRAVAVCEGGVIRSFDLIGGRRPVALDGTGGRNTENRGPDVYSVCLSSDGKRVIVGYEFGLGVWDAEGGSCLAMLSDHCCVWSCLWVGHQVVVADDQGNLHDFAWEEWAPGHLQTVVRPKSFGTSEHSFIFGFG